MTRPVNLMALAEGLRALRARDADENCLTQAEDSMVFEAIGLLETGHLQSNTGDREAWDRYAAALVPVFAASEPGFEGAIARGADALLRERRKRFG